MRWSFSANQVKMVKARDGYWKLSRVAAGMEITIGCYAIISRLLAEQTPDIPTPRTVSKCSGLLGFSSR